MITLLVMTDGRRDYLEQTLTSASVNLRGPISVKLIHDDSGDPAYAAWLRETYEPLGYVIHSTGQRSGFGGAIRSAWCWLREHDRNPLIFHLEDDFTFPVPVPTADMTNLLANPEIAQVSLMRQAWNGDEIRAGGVVNANPGAFTLEPSPIPHLRHRAYFTTNPSIYRRELILSHEWPTGDQSEGRFTLDVFTDPTTCAAVIGDGEPNCHHIGEQRTGNGY